MPKCIVKGCTNYGQRKTMFHNVILHVFPKNPNIIKTWLQQFPEGFGDIDTVCQKIIAGKKTDAYRICSEHFSTDSYCVQGNRWVLRKDAIPTIFPGKDSTSSADTAKQIPGPVASIQVSAPCPKDVLLSQYPSTSSFQSHPALLVSAPVPSSSNLTCLPIISSFINSPEISFPATTPQAVKTVDVGVNTDSFMNNENNCGTHQNFGMFPALTVTKAKNSEVKNASYYPDTSNKTPLSDPVPSIHQSVTPHHTSHEWYSVSQRIISSPADISYDKPGWEEDETAQRSVKSKEELTILNENCDYKVTFDTEEPVEKQSTSLNPFEESTLLVFESCLDKLLMSSRCLGGKNCSSGIKRIKKYYIGSFLSVRAVCHNGHHFHLWNSQPSKGHLAYGNILLSAAALFSKSSFANIFSVNKLLRMKQITESAHYRYQQNFLFPVINHRWKKEQQNLQLEFSRKSLCLTGDSASNSPGPLPKYCLYTLTESTTNKILSFKVEHSSPSTPSKALKKTAFKKTLDEILDKEFSVEMICTDSHKAIGEIIREEHSEITHRFDACHFAKSLRTKLVKASRRRNCAELCSWIDPTVNHFWWSLKTSNGNVELLLEKWASLVNHVINVHEWPGTTILYHNCAHSQREMPCERKWLHRESTAFNTFRSIVLSKRVICDLSNLSHFYQARQNKCYHNDMLKCHPRLYHDSSEAMLARTELSAMHHNFITERAQTQLKTELRHRPGFFRENKERLIKSVAKTTSNDFFLDILKDVARYVNGELDIKVQS
ncbi:hypothetical protein XENTR_v10012404 [Xenopus tropicalis]|uniref:LOC100145493 protein n=1 Tax=Xenopus tropicalis TaxID=8364 RepID=B1H2V6_XENTR|nr:uncharacterized protein LOC100145493 [Xenopus tropicalis]XP_012816074.1 uncharacterized protein LOC100145493 isoform X1 [Xenopus tropicalis]XP_012816075.1 uncharacterized protein LOC100145493 isoform X1 [Xenopus tropicalis]XP_012816077.1 uncharacterized protein LOC100145493 isoform X1 [Xenopus tropicalis]XP_012816079.1 uncharacterized protein LOC100145493 isoform X1 [Xenopus tropicalis]XP_031755711.1 uncharacterized protein LOC100145493 isoform X1 [Xenopus tropicalis]AAI61146.1 LOC10014549|eukprot:XP_012816074.1 PREDICTED: uncharacterized protein LOC100145493 isoform X1 [Xenopus tropicalis]